MPYAEGIDISRYNVSFDPTIANKTVDFVIQKATEGTAYVDLSYENLWAGVSKIGIRGAYHYQRSGMSWREQAIHFLTTARRHDYHMYALDLEEVNNVYNDTFFSDTKRIIDYWREFAPDKKVLLYTNGSTYKLLYYTLYRLYGSSIVNWINNVDFWIASPTVAGIPYLPTVRPTWQIHQYSWTGEPSDWGTGGTRVDENVFNGSVEDMMSWLGILPYTSSIEYLYGGSLKYEVRNYTMPRPITCYIAQVNINDAKIIVTPPKTNGYLDPQRTSEFANKYLVDLAINGDEGYDTGTGELKLIRRQMGLGMKYGLQTDGTTISLSKYPYQLSTLQGPIPSFAYNALSGSKWLVNGGIVGNFLDNLPPDPRTLLGYSRDLNKLICVIIDGRGESRGMTLLESANLMISLGCWQAVNLDGGGSSTMVLKRGDERLIVNNPSDATGERLVANHLGIIFDSGEIMAEYKVWSDMYNMALRSEHNTGVLALEYVPYGDMMYADEIWTATQDLYKVINGVSTKVNATGDKWAHVIRVGEEPKDAWVAVVHLGRTYCTVEEVVQTPTARHIVEVLVDGVLKYREELN